MLGSIRESFAAKILAAVAGTVGLLLLVMWWVVRSETERQVEMAVRQAVLGATDQFARLEELESERLAQLVRPLVNTPRSVALLDEAIQSGDFGFLAATVDYQIQVAQLEGSDLALVFTDPSGRPVVTFLNAEHSDELDPLHVAPQARALLVSDDFVRRSYPVFRERLYRMNTDLLTLGGRVVGTVSTGLPRARADVDRVSELVGAEVCFVVEGRCVLGSPLARSDLATALVGVHGLETAVRHRAAGHEWSLAASPLLPERPEAGAIVVAVALDGIVAPFRRITRALIVGGLGALALALLAGGLISRSLTRPVRALVAATRQVGGGDYDVEVRVASSDELGILARAFNDMTRGLRMKERYRSVLNKVVSREVAEELMEGGVELGGENRVVTVLFADIRGFTALTDGMEPQEVIGLLNACMERLSAAVESEGGVVDKYVGDELMAVFGAPLARPDDAEHAVRAAVAMQTAVERWNRDRDVAGLPSVGLGVSLNTGVAVAGNMGSTSRLNYTVLGDVVNLASRVCGAAGPGEILVTREVVDTVGGKLRSELVGPRTFKGFAREVEVHRVLGLIEGGAQGPTAPRVAEAEPHRQSMGRGLPVLMAILAAGGFGPEAQAQEGWPTLRDAGVGYVSASGGVQVDLTGRLDVDVYRLTGHDSGLAYGVGVWPAPRLQLFSDIFVGDHLYGLLEMRADRGHGPSRGTRDVRLEQAFLRVGPQSARITLQAGRFASPFGPYAARHRTEADPFLRPPLGYDYRTVVSAVAVASDQAGFRSWKDRPDVFRTDGAGAPPVWGVPYQWGAMASGWAGPVSWRAAAMNSAPSSEPDRWGMTDDGFALPSWIVGLGFTVTPALQVGASWNRGPYLEPEAEAGLGKARTYYTQEIVEGHLHWARGPLVVRVEVFRDAWKVPNVAGPAVEWGYSAEAQADVAPGLFIAGRWGRLDFRPLSDGGEWDYDVARWEGSVGYRLARNAGVLVTGAWYDRTAPTLITPDGEPLAGDLLSVGWWWSF